MPPALTINDIRELQVARRRVGREVAGEKVRRLKQYSRLPLRSAGVLRAYHDELLFMAAYPDSAAVRRLAESELDRLAGRAAELVRSPGSARRLLNSGIAGTEVDCPFTVDTAAWLRGRYGADVDVAWEDESAGDQFDRLLAHLVVPIERDGLNEDEITTQHWTGLARGPGGGDLQWIVDQVRALPCPPEMRDYLFEHAHLSVRWHLRDSASSITGLRLPRDRYFQHGSGIQRGVDLRRLIEKPPPQAVRLPAARARETIEIARASLCARSRETDPVTYANPREITHFPLERGVDLVVFGMDPGRRQPIESFFGYLAAKNGVPVAYGGGWVFFGRCEIGLNVFESFRGGESALLFGQILRVYRHHFRVSRFAVDPYQIGAGNRDGIRSGAFWFYYRLGFRPADDWAVALADAEHDRMRADRAYRSPARTLRRLAESRLVLVTDERADAARPAPDLLQLSLAVTAAIGRRFGGDRIEAMRWARTRVNRLLGTARRAGWSPPERAAFDALSLLAALADDLDRWPPRSRQSLAALLRSKGGPRERDYVLKMQGHDRFREALAKVAAEREWGLSSGLSPLSTGDGTVPRTVP
jgi:hypothetical protein